MQVASPLRLGQNTLQLRDENMSCFMDVDTGIRQIVKLVNQNPSESIGSFFEDKSQIESHHSIHDSESFGQCHISLVYFSSKIQPLIKLRKTSAVP